MKEFHEALGELRDVLKMRKTKVVRDSAIKRFELTFELSWKAAKAFLEDYRNVRCASPQMCFRELFNHGIIDYDEMWIKMAEWRNSAVHTYKESLAEKLYKDIPKALKYFQLLKEKIKNELK